MRSGCLWLLGVPIPIIILLWLLTGHLQGRLRAPRLRGHDAALTGVVMRRTNWRVVIVGVALAVLAVGFFLVMMALAPKSNDPVALLRIVGQVSGVVGGIGGVMIIVGSIGKKV